MKNKIFIFLLNINSFNEDVIKEYFIKNYQKDFVDKFTNEKIFSLWFRYYICDNFFHFNPNFSINSFGKPIIKNSDFYLNISHNNNYIAIVFSKKNNGIDLEFKFRKCNYLKVANRYFSQNEYKELLKSSNLKTDFLTLWTLKEAEVKRNSLGIAKGLKTSIFEKNNDIWKSINFNNDFFTFFYKNLIISICQDNIVNSYKEIFVLDSNFNFNKITNLVIK